MTPPEAPRDGSATGDVAPAVSVCLTVLAKRSDFLAAARARRQAADSMMVQARRRDGDGNASIIRVGFTCSKKVGNSVARNRAKRRLREVARLILPELGQPGWDYVLIGRAGVTGSCAFSDLQRDLAGALRKLHAPR